NPSSLGTDPVNSYNFATGQEISNLATSTVAPATNYPSTPDAVLGSTPVHYAQDPGVKNPYLFTRPDPVQPPPIPPRRLFQVPDYFGYLAQPPTGPTPPP